VTSPLEGARLLVVVGAGGVGKTTLSAALGVVAAADGARTLVMTFDPSLRLKDALGVSGAPGNQPVPVGPGGGRLEAGLLDAGRTFDALVRRYAPDDAAARRILENRFYRHLAGQLAGVLEYMAVERLFEVATEDRYDRVILDTPPTRQALEFLEAPERIVGFLDSGALRIALKPWFNRSGAFRRGPMRRQVAGLLDRLVGLDLLRDMAEFFQAFAPLYAGFRQRAKEVQALLRRPDTGFLLVSGPGESRVPDTVFFARKLQDAGHHLAAIVVNQIHDVSAGDREDESGGRPRPPGLRSSRSPVNGPALFRWLADRDARGLVALRQLVVDGTPVADLPLLAEPPAGLAALEALGRVARARLDAVAAVRYDPPAARRGRQGRRPAPGGGRAWSG
jgi:anion-transporting  ArsA/GET3 family ATPase